MLIVQKFHSIHEIDPEFIQNIEILLEEDVPSFQTLKDLHDNAPSADVFTYFLFFGPTQNAPIGFAQLCLRPIPYKAILPWFKKIVFWNKEHLHWKEASWQIGAGSCGLCVFDSKYARSGKEKLQELIREYENRDDIMAQVLFLQKGVQDFNMSWNVQTSSVKESYVLGPFQKSFKSYQNYIDSLNSEVQKVIKQSWRDLHNNAGIVLGDYPSLSELNLTLPISQGQTELWTKLGAQVLTFEKNSKILGCLLAVTGKNGNVFFEPLPFEPEGDALVSDDLYTQYALLKFFEMPQARKCHLIKFGARLIFDDPEDLKFFKEQGFEIKTLSRLFQSRLEGFSQPL
jgi:hypothetical protein